MQLPHPKRWLILFVILAAECMDLLDGTVVNVAAPTIHHDLHASSTNLQWIVGGYPLALAVGLLIGGRLGDIFGRRRMFLIGAAGFTAASTLCGFAPTTAVLIAARLTQGLFGAMMIPQGLGVIREVFPADELPKAFGLFGPVMGSAAMIGPILGGGLIALDLFGSGWRLVFLINLPLGIAAVIGAAVLLPVTHERQARTLDFGGAVLAAVGALAIVYPLIQGRELGWPAWTYASMGASVVLFALLAVHLRRRKAAGRDPLIEPSVFSHRGYSAGALVLMLYFGGMIGSMLALTLFVQLGEGFSAIHAGLTTAPFALGTAFTAPIAAQTMGKIGGRTLIQIGGLVSMLGYVAVAVIVASAGHVSTWALVGPLLVVGLGHGAVRRAGVRHDHLRGHRSGDRFGVGRAERLAAARRWNWRSGAGDDLLHRPRARGIRPGADPHDVVGGRGARRDARAHAAAPGPRSRVRGAARGRPDRGGRPAGG